MPASTRPAAIHTFGQPRVGDQDFADHFNVRTYRFVNENDIVPHLPLHGLINRYRHIGRSYLLLPDGTITTRASAWRRLLRQISQIMIFGIGSLPKDSIDNHEIGRYIKKLEGHSLNRRR
jgi:triacylglycerol lipase